MIHYTLCIYILGVVTLMSLKGKLSNNNDDHNDNNIQLITLPNKEIITTNKLLCHIFLIAKEAI